MDLSAQFLSEMSQLYMYIKKSCLELRHDSRYDITVTIRDVWKVRFQGNSDWGVQFFRSLDTVRFQFVSIIGAYGNTKLNQVTFALTNLTEKLWINQQIRFSLKLKEETISQYETMINKYWSNIVKHTLESFDAQVIILPLVRYQLTAEMGLIN